MKKKKLTFRLLPSFSRLLPLSFLKKNLGGVNLLFYFLEIRLTWGTNVDSAGLILNQSRVLALNIKNKTVSLTFNSVLAAQSVRVGTLL